MADTTERRNNMKAMENEMKNLSLNINKAIDRMDKVADLVTANTICISRVETKQSSMDEDIKTLERKSNVWDGLNSILFVIATALGISK